jgi:multicomponent Na+:H+ antiporter subunit F
MSTFLTAYLNIVTGLLLIILLAGLGRVLRGPSIADRMLASQLFGSAGVAILMLFAAVQQEPALLNTALVLALLAPLTLIAFLRLAGKTP